MREIKFRAWEPSTKKMAIPKLLEDMILKATTFDPDRFQWDSDIVMMQYIGLKDTNGVEIYEGDIVNFTRGIGNWQIPNSSKRVTDTCEIKWREETHSFALFYNNSFQKLRKLEGRYVYEVIGNIHENPELL